ncbi:ABC transporter substrate-binding protein [Paenibacillus validus]|uniref:ABC transporter substrate-binding protein n=1 Tax=Paenibacillus validus TaxID=44253 RepID=UPI000FDC1FC4|nr:ABC transporter substrate-binding protein [Paenibacillus validus]MED4601205.1 ABC transporter substrate-binding protein [Paenibacillus validus]MED4606912.1 ABC transporter substrate-binding protein [Paenibacillus validus]
MKMSSRNMLVFALAVMLLVLAGCGPQGPQAGNNASNSGEPAKSDGSGGDAKEIKIGLVLAETGPASTLGLTEVQTQKLFQKQLDKQGPINGYKIKLVMQDYETDDTKAVIAMDRLISEGVVAVVGATQVSTTAAILPKAISAKLPFLTVAPANSDKDNVFVMTPSSKTVSVKVVEWLKKKNITKVAWVNAKDAFGVEGLPAFKDLAKENNIEIVAHEEFDATATDMTVQLTNVKKANPEVVVVWSRTPGAGVVARNFKALGFNIPMIQSTASANQGFLDQVKGNNEGLYVVGSRLSIVDQLPDSDQKKRLQAFRDAFKAEFNGEPDLFAAHTYDGLSMIVEAIKAGHTTPENITKFLNKDLGKYPGITGTFDFAQTRLTSQVDGLTVLGIKDNAWKYEE